MPPAHGPGSDSFCHGNEGFRSPRCYEAAPPPRYEYAARCTGSRSGSLSLAGEQRCARERMQRIGNSVLRTREHRGCAARESPRKAGPPTFWRSQKMTDCPEFRRAIAFRLRQAYAETGGVSQNGIILSEDGYFPFFGGASSLCIPRDTSHQKMRFSLLASAPSR